MAFARPVAPRLLAFAFLSLGSGQMALSQPQEPLKSVGKELDSLASKLVESVESPQANAPFEGLRQILIRGLDSTPALLKRIEEKRFTDAKRDEARSRLLPRLSASANTGRSDIKNSAEGNANTESINVSQLVFDFGSSIRGLQATNRLAEAADARVRLSRSESLLELSRVWMDLRRANQRLELSTAFVASRRQFLDLIRQKEALGASSAADIVRAEAKVFEAADELPLAIRRLSEARSRYKELFGVDPASTIPEFQLPKLADPSNLSPADAASRLTTVLESELKLEAAELELKAARTAMLGAITLEGSKSRTKTPGSAEKEENSVFFTYRVDFFSGFAQAARVDQQGAKQKEAQWELDRVRREALKQLEDGYAAYQAQKSSLSSRVAVLKSAKASSDIAKELFLYNRGSLTDVFRGQDEYLTAARNLVDANADFKISFYTLLHRFDQLLSIIDDPV